MTRPQIILSPPDVTYLDPILLDGPYMRLLPASLFQEIDPLHLRIWCMHNARYQLPTVELIDYLSQAIGGRVALEIGSGMGDICRHLGIAGTDSGLQMREDMQTYYRSIGQVPTNPPPTVERIDALTAVHKYQPQVVIGCWVTQKYAPGDEQKEIGSNVWGIDERAILFTPAVEEYIHVGNFGVHHDKRICPPDLIGKHPWLWSRSAHPGMNIIWHWKRGTTCPRP